MSLVPSEVESQLVEITKALKDPNGNTDNIFQPFHMKDDLTFVQLGLVLNRILVAWTTNNANNTLNQLIPKLPPVLLPGLPAMRMLGIQDDAVRSVHKHIHALYIQGTTQKWQLLSRAFGFVFLKSCYSQLLI